MKKVLFATTALVLSAGVAAAEVSVSGNGRMGVTYGAQPAFLVPVPTGNEWEFSSRIRVVFTLSGTTDGGLEFGGTFRADNAGLAATGNAGTVFIKGAFGTLTMGDVASAPEALFGNFADIGYIGDFGTNNGLTKDIPYLTLDNGDESALQYVYTAGPWSVAASMTDGVNESYWGVGAGAGSLTFRDQQYAVAATYTFGNYLVGLGYEAVKSGDATVMADMHQWELAAVGTFGNTSVKGYYAKGEVDDGYAPAVLVGAAASGAGAVLDHKAYGLGVSSVFGATTVNAYVQRLSVKNTGSVTWWGLGADYDLGGGAVLSAGVEDDNLLGSNTTANIGVKFTF